MQLRIIRTILRVCYYVKRCLPPPYFYLTHPNCNRALLNNFSVSQISISPTLQTFGLKKERKKERRIFTRYSFFNVWILQRYGTVSVEKNLMEKCSLIRNVTLQDTNACDIYERLITVGCIARGSFFPLPERWTVNQRSLVIDWNPNWRGADGQRSHYDYI